MTGEEGAAVAVTCAGADHATEEDEEVVAEGYGADFLAFADDAYLHQGGIDIGDLETDELEGAESQLVEGADEGVVEGANARC